MDEQKKSNGLVIGSVLIIVLAIAFYGVFRYMKRDSTVATENQVVVPPTVPVDAPITYLYKDGIYSSIGNYNSPGGAEEVGVKVTLKDDVIVDAVFEAKATRPASVNMQRVFSENYKPLVIGKKIADLKLDKVSGSSLTPKGFNDAIEKIKTQAKA